MESEQRRIKRSIDGEGNGPHGPIGDRVPLKPKSDVF